MALEGEHNHFGPLDPAGDEAISLRIEDEFSIYTIRKEVLNLARRLGMETPDLGELEIIVRELVTNVLTHGGQRGEMVLSHMQNEEGTHLALDVIDQGSGFDDFEQALEDGYSTAGTLGGGLGSIQRFAERIELLSTGPKGSHLRVTKRIHIDNPAEKDNWRFALYSRPHHASNECGDQGTLIRHREGILLLLADGLGHGPEAAHAARTALDVAYVSYRLPLEEMVLAMHRKLRKTRGCALSIAHISPKQARLQWLGIGNVAGRLVRRGSAGHTPEHTVFANFNGTVGVQLGRHRPLNYEYQSGDWLVLHSDGLARNWIEIFEQSINETPQHLGKRILRDGTRSSDDASILLGRVRA